MMHITRILAVPAWDAGCHENQVVEAVSVGLVLDALPMGPSTARLSSPKSSPGHGPECGGVVAWGDCVAAPGHTFRASAGRATIQRVVVPVLQGRTLASFRELAAEVDDLVEPVEEPRPEPVRKPGELTRRDLIAAPFRAFQKEEPAYVTVERRLPPAVRYGVGQALLQAVALVRGASMAQVIATEWDLPAPDAPVPIHARSGLDRHGSVAHMIAHRVASLPDAPVEDVSAHLGADGTRLTRYVRWLKERIQQLNDAGYHPTIHLNVRGTLGQIYENDLGRVLGQLYAMEMALQPYRLRVEDPVILESREAQIEELKTLREYVRFRKMNVQLVARTWVNAPDDVRAFVQARAADVIRIDASALGNLPDAVEAVLACRAGGVETLLDGARTDLSARVVAHMALAARPDLVAAGPDLGLALVRNEMVRTLALMRKE